MRRLSRSRRNGQRADSSSRRPTLPLRDKGIDELGQRARPKSGKTRYIGDHEPGRAQLGRAANRSRRGLRQLAEMSSSVCKGIKRGLQMLEHTRLRIAILAIVFSAIPALTGYAESPAV